MSNDENKATGEIRDPANYRAMQEPHENEDAAWTAYEAFYADLMAARKKHRITDVHVISKMRALSANGQEGEILLSMHLGNQAEAEAMCAFAYGQEKVRRADYIASALSGKKRK
jgi:hypothetical protein